MVHLHRLGNTSLRALQAQAIKTSATFQAPLQQKADLCTSTMETHFPELCDARISWCLLLHFRGNL